MARRATKIMRKKFKKKEKKASYVEWDESEPSYFKDVKNQEANLSITNPNICFMAHQNDITCETKSVVTLEVEDIYIELTDEYKKLFS